MMLPLPRRGESEEWRVDAGAPPQGDSKDCPAPGPCPAEPGAQDDAGCSVQTAEGEQCAHGRSGAGHAAASAELTIRVLANLRSILHDLSQRAKSQ